MSESDTLEFLEVNGNLRRPKVKDLPKPTSTPNPKAPRPTPPVKPKKAVASKPKKVEKDRLPAVKWTHDMSERLIDCLSLATADVQWNLDHAWIPATILGPRSQLHDDSGGEERLSAGKKKSDAFRILARKLFPDNPLIEANDVAFGDKVKARWQTGMYAPYKAEIKEWTKTGYGLTAEEVDRDKYAGHPVVTTWDKALRIVPHFARLHKLLMFRSAAAPHAYYKPATGEIIESINSEDNKAKFKKRQAVKKSAKEKDAKKLKPNATKNVTAKEDSSDVPGSEDEVDAEGEDSEGEGEGGELVKDEGEEEEEEGVDEESSDEEVPVQQASGYQPHVSYLDAVATKRKGSGNPSVGKKMRSALHALETDTANTKSVFQAKAKSAAEVKLQQVKEQNRAAEIQIQRDGLEFKKLKWAAKEAAKQAARGDTGSGGYYNGGGYSASNSQRADNNSSGVSSSASSRSSVQPWDSDYATPASNRLNLDAYTLPPIQGAASRDGEGYYAQLLRDDE